MYSFDSLKTHYERLSWFEKLFFPRALKSALYNRNKAPDEVFELIRKHRRILPATFFAQKRIKLWERLINDGVLDENETRTLFNDFLARRCTQYDRNIQGTDRLFYYLDILSTFQLLHGEHARRNLRALLDNADLIMSPQLNAAWDRLSIEDPMLHIFCPMLTQDNWDELIGILSSTGDRISRAEAHLTNLLPPGYRAFNALSDDSDEEGTYFNHGIEENGATSQNALRVLYRYSFAFTGMSDAQVLPEPPGASSRYNP